MFKAIQGYEDLYEVSDEGVVRSINRNIINKNGKSQFYPGKILIPDVSEFNTSSYHRVTLSKNHKTKRFLVHRLVAEAFIPNDEAKEYINHIDNDGTNNVVSNLEWCTHSENMIHAQKQGRLFSAQSKGGKAGGQVGKDKQAAKVVKLVGTTVGHWKVVGDNLLTRAKKLYIDCICKCGKEEHIDLGRLQREEVSQCKSCSQLERRSKS